MSNNPSRMLMPFDHSLARAHHTAWTPSSLPNSIVLLGGLDEAQLTAEIVPGTCNSK